MIQRVKHTKKQIARYYIIKLAEITELLYKRNTSNQSCLILTANDIQASSQDLAIRTKEELGLASSSYLRLAEAMNEDTHQV